MLLSDKDIDEIAEFLDCGMVCYLHRPTGTIEYYPDPDDFHFEPELWKDTIKKIDKDRKNYDKFNKMDSNQGYRVMENFALELEDKDLQRQLLERLNNRKPFQNFKMIIDSSDYRQDWFDFKKKAYLDWVRQQING